MKPELREKIKKSNLACEKLEKAGYTCQGVTSNLERICVTDENQKQYFFPSYIEAAEALLK